jgi:hypothetical protein
MNPSLPSLALLVVGAALLPTNQATKVPQVQPSYSARVEKLEKELESVRRDVAILKSYDEDLSVKVAKLEIEKDSGRRVELDLASRDYQRLDTDAGWFLVSVQDVAPYLDGYRVTLNIANPSNVIYHGAALKVAYNKAFDPSNRNFWFATWNKTMRKKKISFANTLNPGAWNKLDVILPSATKEQLAYFAVSMEINTVSLYEPPSQ